MPMTGRSERNLHTAYMRRYRRPRRNISEINELIVNELIDSYKCGLDAVPSGFITFSLGEMNNFCVLCGAKHFKSEMTGRDNDKFTICCHKGKTALPPLTQNTFFQKLCEGINSTNASIKQRSANYLENIRSYNAAFAMVSSECQIAESIMNGVYHFKIHDVFYHRAGALAPRYPQQPC